jgi:hypothetical protein
MARKRELRRVRKTNMLKIDKDCFVDAGLNAQYTRTVIHTCGKYGIEVRSIRCSKSRHGLHFYIRIRPSLEPEIANNLQYLLGDDAKRVAFNKARIESGITEWNKLFERPGASLKTIYQKYSINGHKSRIEVGSYRFDRLLETSPSRAMPSSTS